MRFQMRGLSTSCPDWDCCALHSFCLLVFKLTFSVSQFCLCLLGSRSSSLRSAHIVFSTTALASLSTPFLDSHTCRQVCSRIFGRCCDY